MSYFPAIWNPGPRIVVQRPGGRNPHGKGDEGANTEHQQERRGDQAQIFSLLGASAGHNWEGGIDDGRGKNEYHAADKSHGSVEASFLRRKDVFHHHEVAVVDDHLAGVEEQRLAYFTSAFPKAKRI